MITLLKNCIGKSFSFLLLAYKTKLFLKEILESLQSMYNLSEKNFTQTEITDDKTARLIVK